MAAPALTRRQLLGGAVVGAGALALGLDGCAKSTADPRGRVVVVGAGLAGLTAAYELQRSGFDVTVLEARNRIGGRCHTLRSFNGGQVAEAGGEFIDTRHTQMRSYASQFGLRLDDLRRSNNDGVNGVYRRGRLSPRESYGGGRAASDESRFYSRLDALAAPLRASDPAANGGARYDSHNLAELMDELGIRGNSRFLLDRSIRDDYAIEAEKVSLLVALAFEKVFWNQPDSGIEVLHIHGGNDRLPAAFASRLSTAPRLGSPVDHIAQTGSGVSVRAAGATTDADWCVVAAPLPPLRRVRFEPALPPVFAAAIAELQYGPITKTPVQYRRRFWRAAGYDGDVYTDLPLGSTWEATETQPGRAGILMSYASGDAGRNLARLSADRRIRMVAGELAGIAPGSRRLAQRAASVAWSADPYAGGAYSAWAPGQVTRFWTALRQPAGRIVFAGEHTDNFSGYMEGAVRSGQRAAAQIDSLAG